jgi:tyrosyl-tRNA synthetase
MLVGLPSLQYFLRTLDDHAEQYLRMFTLLTVERIAEIMLEHLKAPEKRFAQRILAEEVVTLLHRTEVAQKCILQTAALYPAQQSPSTLGMQLPGYRSEIILEAFRGDGALLKRIPLHSVLGAPLSRLLKMIGLAKSNSLLPILDN